MSRLLKRSALFLTASFATMMFATVLVACNIPVFRYALERWQSDAYQLVVLHNEELSPEQASYVQSLEMASVDNGGSSNIKVSRERVAALTKPELAVRMSMANGRIISNWRGSLEAASDVNLLDSPVRKELVKRLLAGDSVVWLLVRSKDAEKSNAAKRLLLESFKTLNTKVSLPDGIGLPGSELHSEVPLFVKFSLLEIVADDGKEAFLRSWLEGFHPDAIQSGEPLLVPVFGRGRALEVIPANVANPALVEDLTMFLSGACSCQVKEQNPGFDLLLKMDWDKELYGEDEFRPPPAKSVGEGDRAPRTLAIPPGKRKENAE